MKLPDVSPERLAAVEVDPDLVLAVIMAIAASEGRRGRRKGADLLVLCAAAYAEHAAIDAEPGVGAFEEHDLQVIAGLATRMAALSALLEQGRLKPGGAISPEDLAEAASAARLVTVNGRLGFQLLDFLAHAERAKKAPPRW